jgi:cytochrome P450
LQIDVKKRNEQNNSFIRRVIESKANGRKLTSLADVEFDRQDLIFLVRDLLAAGEDTSASTLLWALSSLANNPDVQIRLQTEVDDVVGRDRQPLLEDESKMPYTQAVILETLRLHSTVPLSLLRATTCDTVLGDYFIPARTTVRLYTSVFNFSVEQDLIF